MTDLQVTNQISLPVVVPDTPAQMIVETRKFWLDEWKLLQFVEVKGGTLGVAPAVSRMQLFFRYGEIQREGDPFATVEDPQRDLPDSYVRISVLRGTSSTPIWYGIITAESFDMMEPRVVAGEPVPQGDQPFTAFGLEHLLDRQQIRGSWAEDNTGAPIKIDWSPPFNRRYRRGRTPLGNRSSSTGAGSHVFSRDGELWSDENIIDYLLLNFTPVGLDFERTGTFNDPLEAGAGPLSGLPSVYELEGKTVRQALNEIITRQKGLGWSVRTDGKPGSPIKIHIFSIVGEPISFGSYVLPANQEGVSLSLDGGHDIRKALLRLNNSAAYEKIVVQGNRVLSCFTVGFFNDRLEKAWTDAEEVAYKAADDKERKTDKHERVYRAFRIPPGWDLLAGASLEFVAPNMQLDGTFVGGTTDFFPYAKTLQRQLPILKVAAIANAEPEFLAPMIFIKDDDDDTFYHVEELDAIEDEEGAQVRMFDREMGFILKPKINHYFALNHFDQADGGTEDSPTVPRFDYESIVATLALQMDQRVIVEAETGRFRIGETVREKLIMVNDADLWYMAGGTVARIVDGELQAENSTILRDDRDRLRTIAALASAWYGQQRAQVEIKYDSVELPLLPGQYIDSVWDAYERNRVGTVVTEIEWNFGSKGRGGWTRLRTDFAEISFQSVGRSPGISSFADVRSEVARLDAKMQEVDDHTGNFPVRVPARPGAPVASATWDITDALAASIAGAGFDTNVHVLDNPQNLKAKYDVVALDASVAIAFSDPAPPNPGSVHSGFLEIYATFAAGPTPILIASHNLDVGPLAAAPGAWSEIGADLADMWADFSGVADLDRDWTGVQVRLVLVVAGGPAAAVFTGAAAYTDIKFFKKGSVETLTT